MSTGQRLSNSRRIGTVEISDTLTLGLLEFKKKFDNVWEAVGPWQSQNRTVTTVAGGSQTCTGSQKGTLTMLARTEERGGKKVWVIDPHDAIADGSGTSSCPGEINPPGDSAGIFLGTFNEIVIPEEGGSIAIHGSDNGPSGTITADGTVNAQTKK